MPINLQKINWKLYLDDPSSADPEKFFKVFNAWIPASPDIFVDVADYRHVHDGPLTVLIGHHEDYWLDATGRRIGLLYNRRQPMEGTNQEKLTSTLRSVLTAALRLEGAPEFEGKVRCRTDEFLFMINDRALAANTAGTWNEVKPDLDRVLTRALGGNIYTLEHHPEAKQRFTVKVSTDRPLPLQALLKNLGA